jgi:transcription-repair coupling factor (superfamily II helicase)
LLADAVRRIRSVGRLDGLKVEQKHENPPTFQLSTFNMPISMPVNVDLPVTVGIPADYIPDQDLRLRLYRRIADLRDETEIEALTNEFNDRFGPLPEMVQNLFYQMRVKLRAEKAGLASIGWETGQIVLRYPSAPNGNEEKRLHDLAPDIRGGKGAYWCTFGKDVDWMERLLETLELVAK